MKLILAFGLFVAVTANVLPRGNRETCVTNVNCFIPDCVCSDIYNPMGDAILFDEVPQMVFLTFDDGVTVENYDIYQEIFDTARTNPNGVPITGTFFVTHEYNNYSLTHQLYRQHHEIALHSITHKSDVDYWKKLTKAQWEQEVVDQVDQMAKYANIPASEIIGFRAPFLQGGGDDMYEVIAAPGSGLRYDSSRPTWRLSPLLWPYTADYDSLQDCQIEPCPTKSYPGFWVPPLVDLFGSNTQPCAMIDTCLEPPANEQDTYDLLMKNFNDHYSQTKAPFGVYTHAAWMKDPLKPYIKEAYLRFVDELLLKEDVFFVSIKQGIEWMQNPQSIYSIDTLPGWAPPADINDGCRLPQTCVYDKDSVPPGVIGERIMNICSFPCPKNYPWIGNPFGDQ